jgi:small conductance mechanosensitive channel
MRMARTVHQGSLLALLGVLFGSSVASAAAGPAAEPAAGANAGLESLTSTAHAIWMQICQHATEYGFRVLGALVILVLGRAVARLLSAYVGKALNKAKVDPTLVPFIENLGYTLMLVLIVIAALAAIKVEVASLIALLGAAGLAIGLALQGALANFASGVLLLLFKPFRVGDFVEIAGSKGTVRAIHVFNTVLDDPNNIRIIVPNGQVTSGNILNYTVNGTRRIDLTVSVSYDDDLKKARRVIESVLAADPRILPEPAPIVAVAEMADSSMDFVVRPWVKVGDYWPVYFDLTEKLKVAIEEHGMTIPFTQQEIYIKTDAAAANALKSA